MSDKTSERFKQPLEHAINAQARVRAGDSLRGHVRTLKRSQIAEMISEQATELIRQLASEVIDALAGRIEAQHAKAFERVVERLQADPTVVGEDNTAEFAKLHARIDKLEAMLQELLDRPAVSPAAAGAGEGVIPIDAAHTSDVEALLKRIAELEALLAERDRRIAELEADVAERDRKLAEKDRRINELEQGAAGDDELQRQLADKDGRIADLEARLRETEQERDAALADSRRRAEERAREEEKQLSAIEADQAKLEAELEGKLAEALAKREAAMAEASSLEDKIRLLQEALESQAETHRQDMHKLKDLHAHQLANLHSRMAALNTERDELRAERRELKKRTRELEQELSDTVERYEKQMTVLLDEKRVFEAGLDIWSVREEPYSLQPVAQAYNRIRQGAAGPRAQVIGQVEQAIGQIASQFDTLMEQMYGSRRFTVHDYVELQCLQRSGEVLMNLAPVFQHLAA